MEGVVIDSPQIHCIFRNQQYIGLIWGQITAKRSGAGQYVNPEREGALNWPGWHFLSCLFCYTHVTIFVEKSLLIGCFNAFCCCSSQTLQKSTVIRASGDRIVKLGDHNALAIWEDSGALRRDFTMNLSNISVTLENWRQLHLCTCNMSTVITVHYTNAHDCKADSTFEIWTFYASEHFIIWLCSFLLTQITPEESVGTQIFSLSMVVSWTICCRPAWNRRAHRWWTLQWHWQLSE